MFGIFNIVTLCLVPVEIEMSNEGGEWDVSHENDVKYLFRTADMCLCVAY